MSVRTKTIQNVSNQIIEIISQTGDTDNAAGDIPPASTGMLRLTPGSELTIEEARLDLGQLANLASKQLISVTDGLV